MKYLLSVLMLSACLSFSLTGQAHSSTSLTTAQLDRHKQANTILTIWILPYLATGTVKASPYPLAEKWLTAGLPISF